MNLFMTGLTRQISILLFGILLPTVPAFSFVDVQVFGGKRTGTFSYTANGEESKKSLSAQEMGAAVHIHPIPMVPLSLGLVGMSYNYTLDTVANDMFSSAIDEEVSAFFSSSATGSSKAMLYGPDLAISVPLPFIRPYLRLSYLVGKRTDSLKFSSNTLADVTPITSLNLAQEEVFKLKETEIGIGLKFRVFMVVGAFLEYSMNTETATADSATLSTFTSMDGISNSTSTSGVDGAKDYKSSSRSLRLGIQVGL